MQKEVVSKEVLQELINKLEEIVNNYCWNLEYFTDSEVDDFFQANSSEITYYNGLINDKIESQNFLWSSKKIAEKIAEAIIESSEYTNNSIKNMSSIQLEYVTSLPISNISKNTIYILKASEGSSKDTLNLYNEIDGWTSIGEFNISLDDYYNKSEIDSKLDDKANADEVISNDKIVQTLDSDTNSADTILSTNGLQIEMDKKANADEVVKKTDITDTICIDIIEGTIVDQTVIGKYGTEILKYPLGIWRIGDDNTASKFTDLPVKTSGLIEITSIDDNTNKNPWNSSWSYRVYNFETYTGNNYFRKVISAHTAGILFNDKGWQKVCATTVSDVGVTTITPVNSAITGTIEYTVKNGICYVSFKNVNSTTNTNNLSIITTMPK